MKSRGGKPWWCLALLFVVFTNAHGQRPARYQAVLDDTKIDNFSYQRFFVRDKFDRRIVGYLSKTSAAAKGKKLPLVVCVQGSGSQSIFLEVDTPKGKMIASGGPEAAVLRQFRDRVRVLVVEKPGVTFLQQPQRPGGSSEASAEFCREFSLGRWVEAVNAATLAVMKRPDIETDRMLVLGHSEGGQVACEVAAANKGVTHVAVMAGGGPTQLFDFLQLARSGNLYDPNSTPQERVDELLADWQRVLEDPAATDKFMLGHTHLRWSTFMKASPISAILKSDAKVLVAQGTRDTNSLPASAEVLYAELLARGRDCTYLRIEDADHSFCTPDQKKGEGWVNTHKRAVDWFLN